MADDLEDLADSLDRAAERAPAEARALVSKGALHIKDDWREAWNDLSHAPLTYRTIGYDLSQPGGDDIIAVIGPDGDMKIGKGERRTPGDLGVFLEHGSVNNAPIPGGAPALAKESPRFEEALGALGERLLSGD